MLIGVAARPFVENALSGLAISSSRLVSIGDTVIIDDWYGTVEDVTLTHTVMRFWDWRGRIRAGPRDPWMPFAAEQHDFLDEPARFFLMDATRSGLPVDVFHAFHGHASASMRVRLLSLVPLVRISGPELRRAETVTLFNDICLLAPSALLDPAIRWETIDSWAARGHYTAGSETVSALLRFGESGELADFVSDDRLVASPGGALTPQRWSTPVRDYRSFGPRRAAALGEGRWHPPEGEYAYLEIELLDLWTGTG